MYIWTFSFGFSSAASFLGFHSQSAVVFVLHPISRRLCLNIASPGNIVVTGINIPLILDRIFQFCLVLISLKFI